MVKLERLKGENILITGGLGFIGSNLAIKLAELGSNITIIDSLDKNCGGNRYNISCISNSISLKIMDLRQESKVAQLVKNKSIIFNLAGQPSHSESILKPYDDLNNNLYAHLSLLESCRKNNPRARVIYSGTRSQYGKSLYLPVDENHLLNPTDINGVNKLAAEKYHLMYGSLCGLNVCCLRITNTYGERHQMKSSKQGFVNWFVRQAIDNKPISVYESGKSLRDVIYIGDVMEAMLEVSLNENAKGKVYNVGSGKPISIKEIAEKIVKICGSGAVNYVKFPEESKKTEVGDFYSNINKIKNEIGWRPKTGFAEGMKRTINFYRENKKHYW